MTETGAQRIRRQLVWTRLISVVEEQAQTLIRTAFSTSVREAGDLSAGIFDLQGRMLAQAVTGTPGHVNAMAASVGYFLERYPAAEMQDGDVFVTNNPWMGTGHLHDFTMVTPAVRNGRVVALFAATSHVVDVGGRGFGADGRQVYEEGVHVPIMPFARAGEVDRSLIALVRGNVREPDQVEGDLYSLAACNDAGVRRLLATMAEFGLSDLEAVSEEILSRSRAGMLAEIAELPRGTYSNSMRIDGYDQPIDLVAALTIAEDGITVDFDGTSGVSGYGINVPLTYTQAYASFGVRCMVGGEIPNNHGSLAPVHVTAPEGSILNAPHPCAVAARHVVGQMLPDVVMGCLDQALARGVPAEGTSALWNPMLLGGHGVVEGDQRGQRPFAVNVFHSGGTGARVGKDGMSATAFPSGVRNTPVEITETISPLVVWRKHYRTDSGGPGRHRGGLGQVMEVGHADGGAFAVSAMFERVHHAPRGRRGGADGANGVVRLDQGTRLNAKGRQTIPAGRRLVMEMPGGGGLGDPFARPAEAVARDVRLGLVTPQAAAERYGVAVDADGAVDDGETARLRAQE